LRTDGARGCLLREERGFTLTEMMITTVIWLIVLFALYSLFDMSIRAFSFGNNKVEAVENARLGLEKMEREIRQAYKVDSSADPAQNHLFFNMTSPQTPLSVPPTSVSQLTFGNELNDSETSKKIECPNPDGDCEYITYKLTDHASNAPCTASPCTLRRFNTTDPGAPGDPVVENVTLNGLTFTFYRSDGSTPANEGEIGKVLVSLNIAVNPSTNYTATQTLATEIDLRNR
jgi:prepilin-type N-terminal cleavage/methylation domain-containing protein